jgi:hypothetical protein
LSASHSRLSAIAIEAAAPATHQSSRGLPKTFKTVTFTITVAGPHFFIACCEFLQRCSKAIPQASVPMPSGGGRECGHRARFSFGFLNRALVLNAFYSALATASRGCIVENSKILYQSVVLKVGRLYWL